MRPRPPPFPPRNATGHGSAAPPAGRLGGGCVCVWGGARLASAGGARRAAIVIRIDGRRGGARPPPLAAARQPYGLPDFRCHVEGVGPRGGDAWEGGASCVELGRGRGGSASRREAHQRRGGSWWTATRRAPPPHPHPPCRPQPLNKTAVAAAAVAKINATKQALQHDAALAATTVLAKKYGCITKDEMIARIQSFADSVPAISQAFWTNGGGADGTSYPAKACQAAFDLAVATLDVAYLYDGIVLFKPTLTTGQTTLRPTRNGALSYFIGTQCLKLVGAPQDQFPSAGSPFYEYGFALNNYNGGQGYVAPTVWDPASFLFRLKWENCDAPVAAGQMCFTAVGPTGTAQEVCVDKTFAFNREKDGTVVITTHHSSALVPSTTTSTTVTQ